MNWRRIDGLNIVIKANTQLEHWRIDTFWEKEPETLKWIESFVPNSKFLDIGANIGLYSLYAAHLGHTVVAVEPHAGNYCALQSNIRANRNLLPHIKGLWACAGHKCGLIEFFADNMIAGSSGGSYIAKEGPTSSVVAIMTIDKLAALYGPFRYVKIDVDGDELFVILGMEQQLKDGQVDECLIEVDLDNIESVRMIDDIFAKYGYNKEHPLNSAQKHSRIRRAQEEIHVENIIYSKHRTA